MHRILFILIVLTCFACGTKKSGLAGKGETAFRFAFYNVENLFDTLDHPIKKDEEYLPKSGKAWNTEKYQTKLTHLASVIEGMQYPALLGLCEVENKAVLEDFTQTTILKDYDYGIVHYESPDIRGIDVALLYQKKYFKEKHSEIIRVPFPDHIEKNYTSRDILYVQGDFVGQKIHFFVNHWPSRRGGLEASQAKRQWVAQHLRAKVDSIFQAEPNANIFITGDFNDEPINVSLTESLQAHKFPKKIRPQNLYNCNYELCEADKGTYNYRGNWNMLDHFVVSSHTLDNKSLIQAEAVHIFQRDWMLYYHKDSQQNRPSRTYSGKRYYGGYSDHLPIYLDIKIAKAEEN